MRAINFISVFLGVSIFMAGVLKFFDPFNTWYVVQIASSRLGGFSYWLGIAAEVGVGFAMVAAIAFRRKIAVRLFSFLVVFSSVALMGIMAVGIFVHLHPAVPGDVLPLKIKPPVIPAFFLVAAAVNGVLAIRLLRRS